ncbi:hypothetical protein GCM10022396_19950 [Flavivirga amylovorans]
MIIKGNLIRANTSIFVKHIRKNNSLSFYHKNKNSLKSIYQRDTRGSMYQKAPHRIMLDHY